MTQIQFWRAPRCHYVCLKVFLRNENNFSIIYYWSVIHWDFDVIHQSSYNPLVWVPFHCSNLLLEYLFDCPRRFTNDCFDMETPSFSSCYSFGAKKQNKLIKIHCSLLLDKHLRQLLFVFSLVMKNSFHFQCSRFFSTISRLKVSKEST